MNCFAQEEVTYIAEFKLNYIDFSNIENILSEAFSTVSVFDEDREKCKVQIYLTYEEKLKLDEVLSRILGVSSLENIVQVTKLEDKDWVEEVQKNYHPITTDKFFIRSSYYQGEIPQDKIEIEINPGRAFGTGEHETTKGCLSKIESLEGILSPKRVLDMGTGSGILSIAVKKLWNSEVLGIDIDRVSVECARDNARLNNVGDIVFGIADGYSDLRKRGSDRSFDLILSNILAIPLINMAQDLADSLVRGGFAIISGFLDNQRDEVVKAHERVGLELYKVKEINNWVVVILQKL